MQYNKPSLSFQDQLDLLRQRGLIIQNTDTAREFLERVSYYRLSAYTRFFQIDENSHKFRENTTFEEVKELYQFDKSLRMIVLNAIESIEIAVRTQVIYHMSQSYGSHWYQDSNLFKDPNKHSKFIDNINYLCKVKREKEVFIEHYNSRYTYPSLPPAYMIFEIVSFGQLSKVYDNIVPCNSRNEIHQFFCLPHKVFVSWLESLTYIRNLCAHHSRLWNRKLSVSPTILKKSKKPWLKDSTISSLKQNSNQRLFLVLCCIQFLLNIIKPHHSFLYYLSTTLDQYHSIDIENMGFLPEWQSEPVWR